MPDSPDIRARKGKGNPYPLGDGRVKVRRSGADNACVSWRFSGDSVFVSHSQRPEFEIEYSLKEWVTFLGGVEDGDPYP